MVKMSKKYNLFSLNLIYQQKETIMLKSQKVPARSLSVISNEIRKDWKKVYFGAAPYLDAMSTLNSIKDTYGCDSAKSIVLYFLSNATTWKGEVARNIKKELNSMLK